MKVCDRCGTDISQRYHNAVYCVPCVADRQRLSNRRYDRQRSQVPDRLAYQAGWQREFRRRP